MSIPSSARLTLCLGALLALQGCNLVIPPGLLNGATITGAVPPKPAASADAKPGELGPGTTKPGRPAEPPRPGEPEPGVMPGYPGDPDVAIQPGLIGKRPYPMPLASCKDEFLQLDADGNGTLSGEEFIAWRAIAADCGPLVGISPNDGSEELMRDGVVASTMARPAIAPAPCGTPHGEPKQLFLKADTDGNGAVDPGEFCQLHGALFGAPPPVEPGGCEGDMKRADQDGDGQVSLDEYLQADYHNPILMDGKNGMIAGAMVMPTPAVLEGRFFKFDLDQNGLLDPKEWCFAGGEQPPIKPPPPPVDGPCDDGERDSNDDGLIDWGEYFTKRSETVRMTQEGYARFKEQAFAEFEKRDTNHDGFLDHAERGCTGGIKPPPTDDACLSRFKGWDADGDGHLSPEEYADGKWSEIRFIKAPTREEEANMRASFYSEFKGHDRNRDGRLSRDEFVATCQ